MEHVRRRQHRGRTALADGFFLGLREAAGVLVDAHRRAKAQVLGEAVEGILLVVDERDLRGDVQRRLARFECTLERRHGVGEALPAGRGRRQDDVPAVADGLDGVGLVVVEGGDTAVGKCAFEAAVEGDVLCRRRAAGNGAMGRYLAGIVGPVPEPCDGFVHTRPTGRPDLRIVSVEVWHATTAALARMEYPLGASTGHPLPCIDGAFGFVALVPFLISPFLTPLSSFPRSVPFGVFSPVAVTGPVRVVRRCATAGRPRRRLA